MVFGFVGMRWSTLKNQRNRMRPSLGVVLIHVKNSPPGGLFITTRPLEMMGYFS